MGCGSSSLKGDEPTGVTEEAPQPIKKVQTNFSTVDYDAAGQGRRDTTVGPLDAIRRKSDVPPPLPEEDSEQSTGFTPNSTQPETKTTKSDQINFENKISDQQPTARDPVTHHIEDAKHKAPYQDVTASPTTPSNNNTFHFEDKVSQGDTQDSSTNMGLFSKSKKSSETAPALTNGTSNPAAATIDKSASSTPQSFVSAQHSASSSSAPNPSAEDKPRKKSFYEKYQDLRRGPGTSALSDDELKKYTGKTREELDAYAQTAPGVAGGQAAGSLTAGGTSGFGMAGGTGEGLGGWGLEAGKTPKTR